MAAERTEPRRPAAPVDKGDSLPTEAAIHGLQDRLGTLLRGAGFNLGGRVIGQFCQLLAHVALARFYGPAAFGLFALGWTIYRLGVFVAPLGLESGVVRFGSLSMTRGAGEVREVAKRALGLASIASITFGMALLVLAPSIAWVFEEPALAPLLRIFAVGLPLAALMRVGVAATRVSQDMRYSVLSEYLLQPVAFAALVVVAYLLGQTVVAGAGAAVVSYGLAAVLALYFANRLFPADGSRDDRPAVGSRELLSFSIPAALAGVIGLAILWTDRLFLGYFTSTETVGIYQAASQSALLFTVATAATGAVLAPLIVDLHSRGELAHLSRLFAISVRWCLIVTAPVFLVLFFVPGAFLHFLFGAEYTPGANPLRVLAFGQVVSVATGAAGYALVMIGRERQWAVLSAIAFAANALLNLILIPRFGMIGAAAATAVSTAVLYVPPVLMLRELIGLRLYATTARLLLPVCASVVSLFLVNAVLDVGPFASLAVNVVVAATVFTGAFLKVGIRPEEIGVIRELLRLAARSRNGGGYWG